MSPGRAEAHAEDARSALTRRSARSYLRPDIAPSHRACAVDSRESTSVPSHLSSAAPLLSAEPTGLKPTHTCFRRATNPRCGAERRSRQRAPARGRFPTTTPAGGRLPDPGARTSGHAEKGPSATQEAEPSLRDRRARSWRRWSSSSSNASASCGRGRSAPVPGRRRRLTTVPFGDHCKRGGRAEPLARDRIPAGAGSARVSARQALIPTGRDEHDGKEKQRQGRATRDSREEDEEHGDRGRRSTEGCGGHPPRTWPRGLDRWCPKGQSAFKGVAAHRAQHPRHGVTNGKGDGQAETTEDGRAEGDGVRPRIRGRPRRNRPPQKEKREAWR